MPRTLSHTYFTVLRRISKALAEPESGQKKNVTEQSLVEKDINRFE
jgi:hypothetical protein